MAARSALPPRASHSHGPRPRWLLYAWLHFIGFAATTLVLTWGFFALFFLAIGGFSIDGLMAQLHNLSSRYVVADPERIGSFKQIFAIAHLAISCILIVLRRHAMFPAGREKEPIGHG